MEEALLRLLEDFPDAEETVAVCGGANACAASGMWLLFSKDAPSCFVDELKQLTFR